MGAVAMATSDSGMLSRGRVALGIRLSFVVSGLLLVGGLLLSLAPMPEPVTLQDIARVAARQPQDPGAMVVAYDDLATERGDPFQFKETNRAPVEFRSEAATQVEQHTGAGSLRPQPDIDQLALVGTAPGNRRAFAVFNDQRHGLTFVAPEGAMVRNAVLEAVYVDHVVLDLDGEQLAVYLTQVPGSEALLDSLFQGRVGGLDE